MMHRNYNTCLSLRATADQVPVPITPEEAKEGVLGVLTAAGMEEQRAAKMDIDDFLKLLSSFNEAGFHFS